MSELTRAHLPAREGTPAQDVDFCKTHLAQVKENLESLASGGDLVHVAGSDEHVERNRKTFSETYREMVKNEEMVERITYSPSPEGATCMSCGILSKRTPQDA